MAGAVEDHAGIVADAMLRQGGGELICGRNRESERRVGDRQFALQIEKIGTWNVPFTVIGAAAFDDIRHIRSFPRIQQMSGAIENT